MWINNYYLQDFENDKIRVVEVERSSPTKLYRYTEQVGDVEEQLTFKKFESVEPDPSVFELPAACKQRLYYEHRYRYYQ